MFVRTQAKGSTSELINVENAVCIGHRKWHDTDEFCVTACFTSDRTVQNTVFLTGPLSLENTELVVEQIYTAIQDGIKVLDLREYGDHSHGRHDILRDHAVVAHSATQ